MRKKRLKDRENLIKLKRWELPKEEVKRLEEKQIFSAKDLKYIKTLDNILNLSNVETNNNWDIKLKLRTQDLLKIKDKIWYVSLILKKITSTNYDLMLDKYKWDKINL